MDAKSEWFVWFGREWFRFPVAQRVSTWAGGSGYKFARNKYGMARKFWTRAGAQACADKLNTKETP